MGCMVSGFDTENAKAAAKLTLRSKPETESGQVLIYICPECGDIGCGAYSVLVEKREDKYVWRRFCYENGYEAVRVLDNAGPFYFDELNYESAINEALKF